MSENLPDHVLKNRAAWSKMAPDWVSPGRRSWSTSTITWGIWSLPETAIGALGDLERLQGKDTIELGCGTAYFSAWLAKFGANPVGIDITPAQIESARAFQKEFGIDFPIIEGSAEEVPLPDSSFDLAISEYGASIWCDPHKWIPEAARLLRPGGVLVFLRNATLAVLCMPESGPATPDLKRDYFGMHKIEWDDDGSVEFQIPTGEMIRLLRKCNFEVEDLIELQAPETSSKTWFDYMPLEWARRWPSEEIWVARKKGDR
jgi:SAM-dependent methyltransferase